MEQGKIAKQMIDFHKATFDNTFNAMSILQEQTERMVNMFLEQSPWVPEDGKKAIDEWVKTYKKGRTDFKATVDDSFTKVDDFFTGFNKETKTKATGKAK
ncbi:MAG: hypothetical protein PHN75_02390 [Syntrophales bacterium]|nr:hypothetical protein [Syntrophales bacterium]